VICPVCGHDNLEGLDNCENCEADLRTVDIPRATNAFEARMQAPLGSLRPHTPQVVAADTPAGDVIAAMRRATVDCVLVARDGRLAGIFTERDAMLKLAGVPLEGVAVGDAMTVDPVVLRPDDTVAVAIQKMAVGGFRHIPVVDEHGSPTGVVAAVDLFHHVLALG
jgi:CBS domain-containing protein